ncbi:MAG: transcriptional regulator [Planctomycetaceae bacterium]|nr:transcriptional regulator [Planctomycetaceae bacterium]MCB9952372.1 transcriptional regulator [Planctomycetaceae bacterium]
MKQPLRFPDSATDDIPREIQELGRLISELDGPQSRELQDSFRHVVECVQRRRRILNLVQEALSQLRLDIKYLMFDLEITREENASLRAQLDETDRDDFGSSW